MTETHEIIAGAYTDIKDVRVKFTTIVEVPSEQTFSEQDILNTIANLEQRKIDVLIPIDAEIEINNQMLTKIRAIDRTINITE